MILWLFNQSYDFLNVKSFNWVLFELSFHQCLQELYYNPTEIFEFLTFECAHKVNDQFIHDKSLLSNSKSLQFFIDHFRQWIFTQSCHKISKLMNQWLNFSEVLVDREIFDRPIKNLIYIFEFRFLNFVQNLQLINQTLMRLLYLFSWYLIS